MQLSIRSMGSCMACCLRLGEDSHDTGIPQQPRRRLPVARDVSSPLRDVVQTHAHQTMLSSTALRKIATPEDVANQIVVLSSSTVSGHVTGHVLMVEGGSEGRILNTKEELGF